LAEVVLKNLSKKFGKVEAVKNVDLTVKDKELLCLLGPSGCGKTTVLRMIAGLELPNSGTVYIGGREVTYLEPKDRDVAMVFQEYALYPHLTVFENIAYPLRVRRLSNTQIKDKIERVAELLDIKEILSRLPSQLSGGQKQRVSLGRAIVREPQIFLMDEPLSSLDAQMRAVMRSELKRLFKKLQGTVIFVTHDQLEAMSMSDRMVVMSAGKIQQKGTPMDIFERPRNSFVAGFIGDPAINFFDCEFDRKLGKLIVNEVLVFPLSKSLNRFLCMRDSNLNKLRMGIRPNFIQVSATKPSSWSFQAEVYICEPQGTEEIINLQFKQSLFKARVNVGMKMTMGQKIWVSFDEKHLYLFDQETGQTLT